MKTKFKRSKQKKVVSIGSVKIGGNYPVAVQSMTRTKTRDTRRTIAQIKRLAAAGCEIARCAVVNADDAGALRQIKKAVGIPVVADVHFDYRLALAALDAGVDKVRINPGNIGETWKLEEVIKKARDLGVAIRIGINAGSLPVKVLARHRHPTPRAMIDTLNASLEIFARNKFDRIVISAKAASVLDTVHVYQIIDKRCIFPLHIGITEAGLPFEGGIRSGVGLGILLDQGIGDTLRVSLTANPIYEVAAAYEILMSLDLRQIRPLIISCPTCGRCDVDLVKIAEAVSRSLADCRARIKVAVMGCVVNGPGEAREADFGIACGKGIGSVFRKGKEIKRVQERNLIRSLLEVIHENTHY
ncbi:MAG TPA: flavodoxin-dependent (E)-4-hydroxy-3-methylbut-2-enyl-diphosphate synthase [bacterium]